MPSSLFKLADRRYFVSALVSSLTHGGLDVYESGLGITTEGNKDQRAAAIIRHIFEKVEGTDAALTDLLNHLYVEQSGGVHLMTGAEFTHLKSKVLDPRGVQLSEDGFFLAQTTRVEKANKQYSLKQIGRGSYAIVYKYKDDDYLMPVAVKQALSTSTDEELTRFKDEFDTLKMLDFPYVLTVYKYDPARHRYTMEFCDTTLEKYISTNNSKLAFTTRKRIALQFLYGINYLELKKILHRDLSYGNVLVKIHDEGAVTLKLSDFGLHKTQGSTLTRTGTAMKGTIVDPTLESFKDYALPNEIHAIGYIVSYIFTGRQAPHLDGALGHVIRRCINVDLSARFKAITEIITAVERLEQGALTTPAKS